MIYPVLTCLLNLLLNMGISYISVEEMIEPSAPGCFQVSHNVANGRMNLIIGICGAHLLLLFKNAKTWESPSKKTQTVVTSSGGNAHTPMAKTII